MRLLNKTESARKLRISAATLDRLIRADKLQAVRIGRRVLLKPETLHDFIEECAADEETPSRA